MGLRGPQPKPRKIRLLEGVTKPSKLNQREPEPDIASLEPPAPLSPEARAVWDALAPELIRIGTLSLIDVPAFLRYIDLTIEYHSMQRLIAGQNYFFIIRNDDGTPKYVATLPQVSIRNQALANLLKLEAHFGMTPASRTRVFSILTGGASSGSGGGDDDYLGLDD